MTLSPTQKGNPALMAQADKVNEAINRVCITAGDSLRQPGRAGTAHFLRGEC